MRFVFLALGLAAALSVALPARAADSVYTGYFSSTALDGYDAVAYFSEGRPVKGSPEFEYEWRGATWRFADAEHLEAFRSEPDAFAPQYGGYCAYAVANNTTAPGEPIVDSGLERAIISNGSVRQRA